MFYSVSTRQFIDYFGEQVAGDWVEIKASSALTQYGKDDAASSHRRQLYRTR